MGYIMVIYFIVIIQNVYIIIYFLFPLLECKSHKSENLDFFSYQVITRLWYCEMLDVSVVLDVQ